VRGAVVGALEIGDIRGRVFTPDEVHLAQAFADRAVLSSENARLYAELEARLRQLETSQEQLLQAGKLAALGQLVSGVAHEINNPLTVISGYAQMLSRRLSDRALQQQAEKILDAATRAAKIVQNLQTFGRPRPREVSWIDPRDVITRALALREDGLRFQGIELIREIPASVPAVRGDAAQLEQVILNLVLNAEQALVGSPAPRITVRLRAVDRWLRVSVTDTGPGIAPDVLPRIFEPFFTTKPVGQGTGLGLSICYSIAQSHNGRLVAESLPGYGATFVLDLPADLDEPIVTEVAAQAVPPSLSQGRVLIVDDEEEVAGVLRDLLEDVRVEVRVVTDGETAWRALTTEGLTFDAVTLDLRMPGLSGRTLYERLEKRAPAVAATVIFATGDTVDSETQLFLRRSTRPVLTKPFTRESLLATLAPFLTGAK
jgi:signal transduction histidine kinase/CheY-like chemotaxis protein